MDDRANKPQHLIQLRTDVVHHIVQYHDHNHTDKFRPARLYTGIIRHVANRFAGHGSA